MDLHRQGLLRCGDAGPVVKINRQTRALSRPPGGSPPAPSGKPTFSWCGRWPRPPCACSLPQRGSQQSLGPSLWTTRPTVNHIRGQPPSATFSFSTKSTGGGDKLAAPGPECGVLARSPRGHQLPLQSCRGAERQEQVGPYPLTSSKVGLAALFSLLSRHHCRFRKL